MSIGTLFTLFVVPSVYVLLAENHRSSARRSLIRKRRRTVPPKPIRSPTSPTRRPHILGLEVGSVALTTTPCELYREWRRCGCSGRLEGLIA